MTTKPARRRVPINQKTLDATEILFLVLLDEHQGQTPLAIKQVHRRMKPHAVNESDLHQQGYIRQAKGIRGTPSPIYIEISPEGREALRIYYPSALSKLDGDIQRQTIAEQKEVMEQLAATLRKPHRLEKYCPDGEDATAYTLREDDELEDEGGPDEDEAPPAKPRARAAEPAAAPKPRRRTEPEAPMPLRPARAPRRRNEDE